jgi:phosphate uptake regulator
MEIRRVQMTGGSSYALTLPKEWITSLNIKKNDPIGLLKQSDGTLLITPKINRERTQRTKEFRVDNTTNTNYLYRKLIGAYIAGYNSIEVLSKDRIKPSIQSIVRKFTQTAIGQEVVEETDKSIIIKDLMNPAEMPFTRTLKRMHIMAKGMYEDTISALKHNDKKVVEEVISRDDELDRLHWLVARQHNIILRNIDFAEKMNTTIENAETAFLISRIIERIGDHIIKISKNSIEIIDEPIDEKLLDKLHEASMLSLTLFNKSISAFIRKELTSANMNIESVKQLEQVCAKLITQTHHQESPTAVAIGNIVDSIRRIGEYSEDISENVINHLVGKND